MGYTAKLGGQADGEDYTRQQAQGEGEPPTLAYANGIVHLEVVAGTGEVIRHHLSFVDGALSDHLTDNVPGPWALVCSGGLPDHTSDAGIAERLGAVTMRIGGSEFPLPPLDDLGATEFAELPHVDNVDLHLRCEFSDSPVGLLRCEFGFLAGARVHAELVDEFHIDVPGVPFGAAEVTLQLTWRNYLRLRAGRIGLLDAVSDAGAANGHWTHLLLLHGLFQVAEHQSAYASLPFVPDELAWFGEVVPWLPKELAR
jgi:hypothetical protein